VAGERQGDEGEGIQGIRGTEYGRWEEMEDRRLGERGGGKERIEIEWGGKKEWQEKENLKNTHVHKQTYTHKRNVFVFCFLPRT
jgi:hypothetical protein